MILCKNLGTVIEINIDTENGGYLDYYNSICEKVTSIRIEF